MLAQSCLQYSPAQAPGMWVKKTPYHFSSQSIYFPLPRASELFLSEASDYVGQRQVIPAVPSPEIFVPEFMSIIKWLLLYATKFGLVFDAAKFIVIFLNDMYFFILSL